MFLKGAIAESCMGISKQGFALVAQWPLGLMMVATVASDHGVNGFGLAFEPSWDKFVRHFGNKDLEGKMCILYR